MLALEKPQSGRVNLASPSTPFDSDRIQWPSLVQDPQRGSAYSFFRYQNVDGTSSPCVVKNTLANIRTAFSVTAVA
jgi:hypothetical protein